MTPVDRDFDQMLRRALHAEVDSIEPADGGLDRIRQRMRAPWLVRQTSLMLTESADLVRLIGIRLEPKFSSMRAAIADRGGAWVAFVGLLSSMVSVLAGLFTPARGRGATHRGRTGRGERAREGSSLAWLRPALAVAGAVVIVVAGVYGLAQVRDNLVLELFPGSSTPAGTGGGAASSGRQGPIMEGQSAPAAIEPTSTGRGSAKASPRATCTRASSKQAAPSPSVSVSPTPTVTPSVSPDPTPSDTTTPATSDTAAAATTAALTVNLNAGTQTGANAAPTTRCTTPSPARKS